jgi:hypothetical protein
LSVEELRGIVDAIAGVAASEIEAGDADEPVVRVWLDGTRDPDQVARDVDHMLRDAGFAPRESAFAVPEPMPTETPTTRRPNGERARRSGLGRGLGALIQPAEQAPRPSAVGLVGSIAVVQSSSGTAVRVSSVDGRSADAPVDPGMTDFLAAATAAVGGLLGIESDLLLVASEERTFGGARVVSVVVDAGGNSYAGSAVIESGELYAYAQALWAALRHLA